MRRSQVTLFILLGLVLLVGTIITVAVYQDWLEFRPPEEYVIDEQETELQPVVSKVDQCQRNLADEAIRQILSTGGYMNPIDHGISPRPLPGGNAVDMGATSIAYWHYQEGGLALSEQHDLMSDSQSSISNQISRHIDDGLNECISWEEFPQYEITYSEPSTAVTFTSGRTSIISFIDVSIQTPQGTKDFDSFTTELPAPVLDLYDDAEQVIETLSNTAIPENYLMQWLAIYAIGEGNFLPPLYGAIERGYGMKIWPLSPAKRELVPILTLMADRIQYKGTSDMELLFSGDERINRLYQQGIISVDGMQDTSVKTYYPSTEPYLAINGNRGAAIPRQLPQTSLFTNFMEPLYDYRFAWDVTFPVVVVLQRGDYELQVAYEANIRQNSPQEHVDGTDTTVICDNAGGSELTLRTSPQEDIPISMQCGEVSCYLGETENGELQTRLPACAQGTLEGVHEWMFAESIPITSEADTSLDEIMYLYEPKKVQVVVKGRDVLGDGDDGYTLASTSSFIDAKVLLMRQGAPINPSPDENNMIDLVPGTYEVLVIRETTIDDNPVIQEEERCEGGECFTIDEVNFSVLPTAYLDLSGDNSLRIDTVPDRLILTTASFDVNSLQKAEDLGLLGAIFDLGSELRSDEAVEFENLD